MSQNKAKQLVWLRNDLRLEDNPALFHAQSQGEVQVVFVATPKQWQAHDESAAKQGLKAASLKDIADQLGELGIAFSCLEVDWFDEVAQALLTFCQQHAITDIWFNEETPVDERRRDEDVCDSLMTAGIHCHTQPLDLLVDMPVLTQQQQPFKVFTPYYRRWLQLLQERQSSPLDRPKSQAPPRSNHFKQPKWAGEFRQDLWLTQEAEILDKLTQFCEQKIKAYPTNRDYPALPATSTLSSYLSLGRLGPRRLLASIQYHCADQNLHWQDNDWLRELAWRDFYRQLMLHFPRINMHKAFQPETENVQWRNDEADFKAWCDGKTGFPIIDAAMRQLNQTGWMHNRLRMLTASFLTKLLLIDWRWGERYFMQHLIDGEFAANNGGWQWSASTGCDAAPYFRVFNPTKQSQDYDAKGQFIARFVPELAKLDNKSIHHPSDEQRIALDYPLPIIDYKLNRQLAIEAFASVKKR